MAKKFTKMSIEATMDQNGKITSRIIKGPDKKVSEEDVAEFARVIAKHVTDFADNLNVWSNEIK